MKKLFILFSIFGLSACMNTEPVHQETYPYGLTESEWNQLSIKDKTKIRRDFYFYEKGQVNFVNPDMDIEGRKELPNVYQNRNAAKNQSSRSIQPLVE